MSNSANLPAPYGGQNTNTPNAVLKSPFCESLFNFNTTEAGISLRHGDSKWAAKLVNTAGGVTTEDFSGFVPYARTSLFMCVKCTGGGVQNRYYDISTSGGAPSLAHTSTSGIAGEIFYTYFNKRVFTFGTTTPTAAGDYYDGTTWGAWGYSMPATYLPIGGCAYKHRQYFIFRDTSSYGYSEIDAITGAVTLVPLGGVISEDSELAIIAPISISNESSAIQLLAFVFFSGEVLFYSGSYPDSSDWSLVTTANLGQPLNYNATISPYQGDSLVLCRTSMVSLRDLFLRGSEGALTLSVSENITPDWTHLIDKIIAAGAFTSVNGRIPGIRVAWWKKKNRIVVFFPYYLNSSDLLFTGASYFVFDTLRGGWSAQRSFGVSLPAGLVVFQDNLLFCGSLSATASAYLMIKNKEGASDFQDVNYDNVTKTSYDYETIFAPIPFPKTSVYEANEIEPILESDLYAQTNWSFIADFGRQVSGDQPTDALTTSVAKPAVNVGMQNITYVQVKMSGTTAAGKTVGLDLYSYNVWYDSGEKASR